MNIREEIALRFALEKYGGTKEELYPHWLEVARVEADEVIALLKAEIEKMKNPYQYGEHLPYYTQCKKDILKLLEDK